MTGVLGAMLGMGAKFASDVSPSLIDAHSTSSPVIGGPATVTTRFASGAVTYAWALISGSGITITSPTANSTTFSAVLGIGVSRNAQFRCTATDGAGQISTTDVNVTLTRD